MSILNPTKPKLPSSADLVRQIDLYKGTIQEAEAGAAAIAMSAPMSDEHKKALRHLADAEEHWRLLNSALDAAKRREQADLEANREAVIETQRRACHAHLLALKKNAQAFSDSLATTVQLYHAVQEDQRKAAAVVPIGYRLNDDCLAPGRIKSWVSNELWKLSANGSETSGRDEPRIFPGAGVGDIFLKDQPDKIVSFMAHVESEIKNFREAIAAKKKAD